jgi:hypothetical protein
MIKTTLKEIKNTYADDITHATQQQINEIKQNEDYLREIAGAFGVYGCNGLLLQGAKTGKFYKITRRTSAIFMI